MLSDEYLSNLTDPPIADLVNEKIIVSLMISIQSDMGALVFCDIMEQLIDTKSSYIEIIRNGNIARKELVTYICNIHFYQKYNS